MTTDYSHIEKIEEFLNGELSDDELVKFRLALEQNEELQEEVNLHRDIQKALVDKDSLELKKQLIEISKEVPSEVKMRTSRYLYLSLAATVVLFISLVFALQNGSKSNTELFNNYYTQYPASSTLRGEHVETSFEEAMRLYDGGMYLQAINAFQSEFAKDTSNHLILIYLGNCYLKTQKWDNAVETLQMVPQNSRFVYDAYWFTALSNLREKQRDSAKQLLHKLVSANTIYTKKATELLKELD